eukprot:symbB.v1.2.033380.t1/scaffold4140.1/size44004/9
MDELLNELQPNPDDCTKFEPNPFKQEKCKHCGRLWIEHKGVISEEYLLKFLKKRLQEKEEKEKKEADAEAVQAAAAKKLAKKRASQAAEDDWLFEDKDKDKDGTVEATGNDSDDDMGFRMLLGSEIGNFAPQKVEHKELKVVNLIDFNECDVADDTEEANGEATGSSVSTRAPLIEARSGCEFCMFSRLFGFECQARPEVSYPMGKGDSGFHDSAGRLPSGLQSASHHDLVEEIQLLRQMLEDANEEKEIQVEIVRDDVAEKQQKILELTRQKDEMEALLREARSKIESYDEQPKEEAATADKAEEEKLKARLTELEAKLEAAEAEKAAEAAASSQIQEALVTVSEVTELCSRTSRILREEGDGGESSSSSDLKAELTRCRERAQCAADTAERVISDKRQLLAKLEELERLERERKDYAQAVRDIRLYAERELALVLQRMSISHGHQAELQKLGS